MILRLVGIGSVCALVFVSSALLVARSELDAERLRHAVTKQERDGWKAAAEAYLENAGAQAENARQCLEREEKSVRDAAERAAIIKQARPRARTAEEKVVDDETRRRAVERLTRPL